MQLFDTPRISVACFENLFDTERLTVWLIEKVIAITLSEKPARPTLGILRKVEV